MKKIKFFMDPMENLEPWLNSMAKKGYRLTSLTNFIYTFEESAQHYRYSVQFIGANSPGENQQYLEMLKEDGRKIFRAPLNQGNLAFGRIRFRPYVKGSGKFANTWTDMNREILIVEHQGEKVQLLLTDKGDLAQEYKNIRNAYLQGSIILLLLFVYALYQMYARHFEQKTIFVVVAVALCFIIIFQIVLQTHHNYRKYEEESRWMQ